VTVTVTAPPSGSTIAESKFKERGEFIGVLVIEVRKVEPPLNFGGWLDTLIVIEEEVVGMLESLAITEKVYTPQSEGNVGFKSTVGVAERVMNDIAGVKL
jgi:hypothetical protein